MMTLHIITFHQFNLSPSIHSLFHCYHHHHHHHAAKGQGPEEVTKVTLSPNMSGPTLNAMLSPPLRHVCVPQPSENQHDDDMIRLNPN